MESDVVDHRDVAGAEPAVFGHGFRCLRGVPEVLVEENGARNFQLPKLLSVVRRQFAVLAAQPRPDSRNGVPDPTRATFAVVRRADGDEGFTHSVALDGSQPGQRFHPLEQWNRKWCTSGHEQARGSQCCCRRGITAHA